MNIDIEKKAVGAVRDFCIDNPYLDPVINDLDRVVIWDGFIDIYRGINNKRKVDKFIARVPVQVKGKLFNAPEFPDLLKYPVQLSDIRAYLNGDGCVFFVVLISEINGFIKTQVYYHEFYQKSMQQLIKCYGNQKTRVVEFRLFPSGHVNQADLLLNYSRTYKAGSMFTLDSKDFDHCNLDKFNKIELQYYSVEDDQEKMLPPFHYMTKGTHTLFGEIDKEDSTHKIPLDQVSDIRIMPYEDSCIGAGTKIYFEQVRKSWYRGNLEYQLNPVFNITIHFDDSRKINLNIKPLHKLSEHVVVAEFLQDLYSSKKLIIDNTSIDLSTQAIDAKELLDYSNWILSIKTKLELLGIYDDLIVQLDNDALKQIKYLLHVDGDVLKNHSSENWMSLINIGNIKILVSSHPEADGLQIRNFFRLEEGQFVFKPNIDIDKTYEASKFLVLNRYTVDVDNFNAEVVITDIKERDIHIELLSLYNLLGMECLLAYDMTKKPSRLRLAKELFQLLKSRFPQKENDYIKINYFQSIFREKNSIEKYISEIKRIMADHPSDSSMQMCCNILLSNFEQAKYHLSKIEKDIDVSEWPIMNLLGDN